MKGIEQYIYSWRAFESMCEAKIKNRCIINTKGWRKLREFHMEEFLKDHPSPFGFMFNLKHKHPKVYRRIYCAPKLYHMTRRWRCDKFNSSASESVVTFPSWKRTFEENKK